MERLARLALVCEGDAESPDKAFSGSAHNMLVHLRELGHPVATINTKLPDLTRAWVAARSYSPDRSHWRSRFRYGAVGARAKSRLAARGFSALEQRPDVVLQIGASFNPPGIDQTPYALYCDWNFALSIKNRSNSYSAIHQMPEKEAERINAREAEIYSGAAAIFTISERLRHSFIEDYRLPSDRVVAVNAGPNIEMSRLVAPDRADRHGHSPTILFVGKEFERKGGDVLLKAFAGVRERIAHARLIIVGPSDLRNRPEGVEFLGLLRKDNSAEFEQLLEAYRQADVFCLPTRQDPFPTVVREAMFFSLPCVTTDIWAMPEMVVDGMTGFTVPLDSPDLLIDRLCRILENPCLARTMGAAGRTRAEERYTWTAATWAMHDKIQNIVGAPLGILVR
jgi:glycosyltransferase involved in cell wall biosynthesis